MISRLGSLSGNIVQFCRFLRLKGFSVSTEEESAALKALQYIDYTRSNDFLLALKVSLCRSKKQLDAFDELFTNYWKELEKAVDAKIKDEKTNKKPAPSPEQQFKSLTSWLHGNRMMIQKKWQPTAGMKTSHIKIFLLFLKMRWRNWCKA